MQSGVSYKHTGTNQRKRVEIAVPLPVKGGMVPVIDYAEVILRPYAAGGVKTTAQADWGFYLLSEGGVDLGGDIGGKILGFGWANEVRSDTSSSTAIYVVERKVLISAASEVPAVRGFCVFVCYLLNSYSSSWTWVDIRVFYHEEKIDQASIVRAIYSPMSWRRFLGLS